MAENVNICNIKMKDLLAPTPQNTPSGNSFSPISGSKLSSSPAIPSSSTLKKDQEVSPASVNNMLCRNPAFSSMAHNKLDSLASQSSGYIESLPMSVRRRVASLEKLQMHYSKLEALFQEEILELEKKYHKLYQPLYLKRSEIVNGVCEPTEDLETGHELGHVSETEDKSHSASCKKPIFPEDIKGIPQFWLTAMKNISSLAEIITPEDEKALCYLTDIRMSYLDKPGFRLEFYFADNEFFSNKMISKTYYYRDELGYGGDFVYDYAEGDKIEWKSNKDLTVKVEIKKQRNKNTKQTRVIKKAVPTNSFFRFFIPPVITDDQDDSDSDIDNRLEADYQCGEDIKDKLIPRAVDWFTGAALAYEDEYDDDSDQEYTDEDGNEDEDDDDDDDDNDDNDNKVENKTTCKQKQDSTECRQS